MAHRNLAVMYMKNHWRRDACLVLCGVLRIRGTDLTLLAMTAGELRIGGHIDVVEWLGADR